MKKILVVLLCFVFTGCFEITERISHHEDQSGDYSLTVDFSQSWMKVKSAMFLEEVDGVKIPDETEILQKLQQFKQTVEAINGISNVKTSTDFNSFIFKVSLTYKNLIALNAAMNAINKQKNHSHFLTENSGGFERFFNYPFPEKLINDPNKKSDLQAAKVTAIYTFDAIIKAVSNPKSKLSKNQKAVFLQQNVYNLLHQPSSMHNKIQLNQKP